MREVNAGDAAILLAIRGVVRMDMPRPETNEVEVNVQKTSFDEEL